MTEVAERHADQMRRMGGTVVLCAIFLRERSRGYGKTAQKSLLPQKGVSR